MSSTPARTTPEDSVSEQQTPVQAQLKETRLALDVLNSGNLAYLAELADQWAADPGSVAPEIAALFETLPATPRPAQNGLSFASLTEELNAHSLRDAWRRWGHLHARLDPLGLRTPRPVPELSPKDADPALLARLKRLYGGAIGVEFMHLLEADQRQWWIDRFESPSTSSGPLSQKEILELLVQAEGFEHFCQQRFPAMRRFGLEGGESLVVALQTLVVASQRDGARTIALGMAHRGRLNVMATVLQKPAEAIFAEFAGHSYQPEGFEVSGDVKYHLGASTILNPEQQALRLILLPNPSHLEAVSPVVLGSVRALQDSEQDPSTHRHRRSPAETTAQAQREHLGILVHGDAAFAGQGVVFETLQLSRLPGYQTGGTVHVLVNNQIGFTTAPELGHSGLWNTDIAHTVQAPVLHVNGDDPEAVMHAAQLAQEWRQSFASDVVLDIHCYRRRGHNETDEPTFTQPEMMRAINAHPTTRQLYARKLVSEGEVSAEDAEALWTAEQEKLQQAYTASDSAPLGSAEGLDGPADPTRLQDTPERLQPMTGVPLTRLKQVGEAMTQAPDAFTVHPRLERQLIARRKTVQEGGPLDWATAESLAFGTLAFDGHRVRLSGQDSQRGTFSQRHAVLVDQAREGQTYTPLNHLAPRQAPVEIWNSPLSEYGVLGFDYGYSLANPEALVMWEAQFGDFSNGAQIMIDQFIAAGETKWLRNSGLTLLLPHGYEGAGPEHSSARPERFLQLCAENNLRVCMPSTPASFFHLLRRQIIRRCRKPLVVFTPKSLLRNKRATSMLEALGPQTRFQPVLPDLEVTQGAKRVVLCSGKVYYDLLNEREKRGLKDVALLRLEQLYPFPHHALVEALKAHPLTERVIWCQEEPRNGGAWRLVNRRIEHAMDVAGLRDADGTPLRPLYAGRAASAAPATGIAARHQAEQAALVEKALTRDASPTPSYQP